MKYNTYLQIKYEETDFKLGPSQEVICNTGPWQLQVDAEPQSVGLRPHWELSWNARHQSFVAWAIPELSRSILLYSSHM